MLDVVHYLNLLLPVHMHPSAAVVVRAWYVCATCWNSWTDEDNIEFVWPGWYGIRGLLVCRLLLNGHTVDRDDVVARESSFPIAARIIGLSVTPSSA